MPYPQAYDVAVTADVTIVTTAETTACAVQAFSTPSPGAKVRLLGFAWVTAGTTTSALTARLRKGVDATGALIGEGNPVQGGVVAGSTTMVGYAATDTPGELAGQAYCLTVQQTGATANGTIVASFLLVIVS